MNHHFRLSFCLLIIASVFSGKGNTAGGIVTDGTVGIPKTLRGSDIKIEESLGSRRGGNLFHSFSEFNIRNGQTVTFQENTPKTTTNVISRVTGASGSDIKGTLQVTPGGKANFYLINPNGITFGPNGFVDVPGSIHLSTADEIKFQDGRVFSAVQPMRSSLSSAPPSSFGFFGTSSKNNGLFKIDSSVLNVKQKKAFDVVAGQINISNNEDDFFAASNIKAEQGGEVRLIAIHGLAEISVDSGKNGYLSLPKFTPNGINAGKIEFNKAGIDIKGNGAGKLSIWGGEIISSNSSLINITNNGIKNPEANKGINIHANLLSVLSGSKLATSTESGLLGKSADIFIHTTKSFNVNGGSVSALSDGENGSGAIIIKTGKNLIIQNFGKITTEIRSGGNFIAGDIRIFSQGDIKILDDGIIGVPINDFRGRIGNIHLSAKGNIILNGSIKTGIFTSTQSAAKAGDINIEAKGNLILLNGSQINSGTTAGGEGGKISINAKNIRIEKNSTINAESKTESSGNPGNIALSALEKIQLKQGGSISIKNSSVKDNTLESIKPIFLSFSAPVIILKDDSKVVTDATGTQPAGSVVMIVKDTLLMDSSSVSTKSQEGNGGDISISNGKLIKLTNSDLTTNVIGSQGNGNGGNISLSANNLVLNTGSIQANTQAKNAKGGDINLNVKALIASGNQLITGGSIPVEWQPGVFGFNVIQAAAPSGLNGTIRASSPALYLSGTLANLGTPQFDSAALNWESCFSNTTSSFLRLGKGGTQQRAIESWVY